MANHTMTQHPSIVHSKKEEGRTKNWEQDTNETIDEEESSCNDELSSCTYMGELDTETGKPHGSGCMEYPSYTYQGQWVNGDWSGYGTLTNKETGDIYKGGFLDNKRHGQAVLMFGDGRTYNGEFQVDEMNKGTMKYPDGSIFWGFFDAKYVPHGRGKFSYPDGSVYDGEFHHGVAEGHGRMTSKDGGWYLGEWSNGEKMGLGIEVLSDGKLFHEGTFCNGKPVTSSSFPTVTKCDDRGRSRSCHNRPAFSSQPLVYPTSKHGCSSITLVGPIPRRVQLRREVTIHNMCCL